MQRALFGAFAPPSWDAGWRAGGGSRACLLCVQGANRAKLPRKELNTVTHCLSKTIAIR